MNAAELVFPKPSSIRVQSGKIQRSRAVTLTGAAIPSWLRRKFTCANHALPVRLELTADDFADVPAARRTQSYRLTLTANHTVTIQSPEPAGLQYGLITLHQLLNAAQAGAILTPVVISDIPAFGVRGVQVDMAREFFPSLEYLKKLVDRCTDLKLNTLWLYLENHFHAPGLEDLSVPGGLTPADAHAISAYAAARGIDLVPGTNVLSHMEGWFRLERYSDFCDGRMRSYPVLTDPRAWKLVRTFINQMADAFPSKNFHAGLDELLFTGVNPAAAAAIQKLGKSKYYTDFARRVIDLLQRKGKTVWMWDDMVMGKNVDRTEGFKNDYAKALNRFPRDVVMVHWYYWTNSDGKHSAILDRVRKSGRPVVMAPSSKTYQFDYGNIRAAAENQSHMAQCGQDLQALGYVCTHWESRYGSSFEAGWPLLALSAGFAWGGPVAVEAGLLRRLSFAVTGETDGALGRYLQTLGEIEDFLIVHRKVPATGIRSFIFLNGPDQLWRRLTGLLSAADRTHLRKLLAKANVQYAKIGRRDPALRQALELPVILFTEGLNIVDAFDRAWDAYHQAALIERRPRQAGLFRKKVQATVSELRTVSEALARLRGKMRELEGTGHTPYDSYALGQWIANLENICRLVPAAAKAAGGLPYFEKLLYLPDTYYASNLRQLQVQNGGYARYGNLPWLTRARTTRKPKRQ